MRGYDYTKLFLSTHNTQLGLPSFKGTYIIRYHKDSHAQVHNYSAVFKKSPFKNIFKHLALYATKLAELSKIIRMLAIHTCIIIKIKLRQGIHFFLRLLWTSLWFFSLFATCILGGLLSCSSDTSILLMYRGAIGRINTRHRCCLLFKWSVLEKNI